MKKFDIKKIFIPLFCLLVSFVILFICSKNSPLYPFNDWVDANAFMTVGKGMVHGVTPYLSLFEQKGPFLYLIYGIASLISFDTFIGVFLLELAAWTVFLYYCSKIILLYLDKKYIYMIIPVLMTLMVMTTSFTHGGSAEEFALPFLAVSAYSLLNFFKNKYPKKIAYSTLFINGLIAGLIAMIKYTLLGFWFGFMLSIIIIYFKDDDYKEIIKSSIVFLCGMFIPMIGFCVYFYFNNALYDFIYQYIFVNITSYPNSHGFLFGLLRGGARFFAQLWENALISVLMLIGVKTFIFDKHCIDKKEVRTYFAVVLFFSIFAIYAGGIAFKYYFYFLTFFALFGLIGIVRNLELENTFTKHYLKFLGAVILIVCASLPFHYNLQFARYDKEDLVQYIFADIISETPNATILNYGFLDGGFYTTTKTLPNIKYFMKQNIEHQSLPDILNAQNDYIRSKRVDYIIMRKEQVPDSIYFDLKSINENYDLVMIDKQAYEGHEKTYALYKKKGI